MRFRCGACQTKYEISDEKVRGKAVVIRCKACGARVSLTGTMAALSEGKVVVAAVAVGAGSIEAPSAPAEAPAAPKPREWHVAIDGKESGPFTEAELLAKIRARELRGRDHVWHEDLPAWTPIRDEASLAPHLPARPSLAPAPPPAIREAPAPAFTDELSEEPTRAEVPLRRPTPAEPPPRRAAEPPPRRAAEPQAPAAAEPKTDVVALRGPALPSPRALIAAAASLLLVGVVGGVAVASRGPAPAPEPSVVAEAAVAAPTVAEPVRARAVAKAAPVRELVPIEDRYAGPLPDDVVRRIVDTHGTLAGDCARLSRRPVNGTLELSLRIEPTGKVGDVTVETAAMQGAPLAECLSGRMKRWRFPESTAARQVRVPYVFASL